MEKRDEEKARPMPDLGAIEALATGEVCVDGFCGVPAPTPVRPAKEVPGSTPATDSDDDDSNEE